MRRLPPPPPPPPPLPPLPSPPSPVDTQASPSDLHSVVHQVIGQSPCIAQVTRSQVLRVRRGEGVVDGNVPASKSVNTCVGDGAGAEPQVSAHNGLQTQSPPHCADCSSVPLSTLASSSPSLLSPPLTSSPRPYSPPPPAHLFSSSSNSNMGKSTTHSSDCCPALIRPSSRPRN